MHLNNSIDLKISMTSGDAYNISCDIKRMLLQTCESHWYRWYINHNKDNHSAIGFQAYIEQEEKSRLAKLKFLLSVSGYVEIYEHLKLEIQEIYKKKVKES
jgi:hypothetical protein